MTNEQSQTSFYQKVYDDLYSIGYHENPAYSHSYGLIEYMTKELRFKTVLDVGASIGAAVSTLRKYGKEAMGLEASLVAVNKADILNRPVMWGESTKLPFADKHVDVVMSTDMLEHLKPEDVDKTVEEFHRVARDYIAIKVSSEPERAGWGKRVGVDDLHLTQKPVYWWRNKFTEAGGTIIMALNDTFVIEL